MPNSSEKEATSVAASVPAQVVSAPIMSVKEKLKQLRDGPGSMTAYLEFREREKQQVQEEIPHANSESQLLESNAVDTPVDEGLKRKRGKTRMDHVHNRADKKRITLNYLNQPIADDGKLLSEFSHFLGTTVRKFVSLTCISWRQVPEKELLWEYVKDKYIISEDAKDWVLKTLNDHFRSFKSKIKKEYYSQCANDEERMEKRPEEVPLSDWKILLKYWGDKKVKNLAKKNAEARANKTEIHTTGPRSFAQLAYKMELKKREEMQVDANGEGDREEEEPVVISEADIYLATRKRKENDKYKLPDEVLKTVNDKLADVKKILQTQGVEAANKLIHAGKEHHPSYLIGRLVRKKEPKSKSTAVPSVGGSDQYVEDLTAKIKAQLQQEMDEKLDQKVRQMMKLLDEKNPDLNLKIDDSEKLAEKSSEESYEDDDDDVTP